MKTYTLIRFHRQTGAEIARLRIAEPKGFRDMEEVLKRDMNVHGVFFSYSSEIEIFNYLYTAENGQQAESLAYDFVREAYDEDGTASRIQLQVVDDTQVIFDLFLNPESFQDDPLNKIWTCTAETLSPFLLKERQEQKVILSGAKTIRLRRKDIIRRAEGTINPDLAQFQPGFNTVTPPYRWEDESIVQGLLIQNSYDANEELYLSKQQWQMDYDIRAFFAVESQTLPSSNVQAILEIIIKNEAMATVFTDNVQALANNSAPFPLPQRFYFDLNLSGTYIIPPRHFVFVNVRTVPANLDVRYLFSSLLDIGPGPIQPSDSFIQLDFHDIRPGTPCSGNLLQEAFAEVLNFHGFTLESNILNDIQDLGSIFLTLGRRIAQATEDIDIAVNYKDLFEQSQKLFNLGYALGDASVQIEGIDFFYNLSQSYTLPEVSELRISLFSEYNYNVFTCGYKKYKEDALGKLYENESFNSKREYNLPASKFEKKLNVESEFVTSNWVIEKLRRDIEKQDDQELFLIALNRDTITSTQYSDDESSQTYGPAEVAEGFEPFDDPGNEYGGLDETGLINIRLSPRRIAQRWASVLKTALYKFTPSEQVAEFITGEPKTNFITAGLSERGDVELSGTSFIFLPEKYTLQTYLSEVQFQDLKSNHLYSRMDFAYNGRSYAGFIQEVKYNHRTQLAEMILIAAPVQ